ncbi:unnamed protein product [Cuscuta epithymum]|uniref:Uncharacterized protein n=1 Tax=Cuscuta epithymum TaxID=186058 RepID=A0AAV0CJF4_9ASTE|nr:unnamed protein product [Cuscuta epithymum]
MVISALLGSCSDTIQPIISSAASAKQAWDKLSHTFASSSRGRIIALKTALARTKKGSNSITTYLAEILGIADDLALAQNPVCDEDLVITILNGLGLEYNELASAIRVRTTPLPVAELREILLELESRQQEQTAATESLIPAVHATSLTSHYASAARGTAGTYDRRQSSRRGRGGRFAYSGPQSNTNIICKFCDNPGHDVKVCRKLQRFLRDNNISQSASPKVNHTATSSATSRPQWLFDSGASHHVASDVHHLPTYTDYGGPEEVQLGNGSDHGGVSDAARGEP